MGHKDDAGQTFGPGHKGWYRIKNAKLDRIAVNKYVRADSAFQAAQQSGTNLSDSQVTAVTCKECIKEIENPEMTAQYGCDVAAHSCNMEIFP